MFSRYCWYSTGRFIWNMVLPLWLSLRNRLPFSSRMIVWLHAKPIPMELSFTFFIFYITFSSRKGTNRYCCLCWSIPTPESITCISRFEFGLCLSGPYLCEFLFFLFSFNKIIRSPLNWLYFIPFWMMLKIASWKFFQSALSMAFSKSFLLIKWTFISRFLIKYWKGSMTFWMNTSGS